MEDLLFPIRCQSCNAVIGNKYETYKRFLEEERERALWQEKNTIHSRIVHTLNEENDDNSEQCSQPSQSEQDDKSKSCPSSFQDHTTPNINNESLALRALQRLGVNRPCCRRHFLCQPSVTKSPSHYPLMVEHSSDDIHAFTRSGSYKELSRWSKEKKGHALPSLEFHQGHVGECTQTAKNLDSKYHDDDDDDDDEDSQEMLSYRRTPPKKQRRR
jgi:DNA-directed RNA polymerase subunit N (RpoN/RPB10)